MHSYLHFAAKLEVGQVPSIDFVRLELQVIRLAFEVEQRDVLDTFLHSVGNNTLTIDSEKSASVKKFVNGNEISMKND